MSHTVTMTQQTDGSYLIECPTCGRKLIITTDPYTRTELVRGDPTVGHSGGVGVTMHPAVITDNKPFEDWAEANL